MSLVSKQIDIFHSYLNQLSNHIGKTEKGSEAVYFGLVTAGSLGAVVIVNKLFGTDPLGRTWELLGKFFNQEKKRNIDVNNFIDTYNTLHDDKASGLDGRNSNYQTLVNSYYELATLFYEWGWGQSFHFAYQFKFESFREAIARHEYYLGETTYFLYHLASVLIYNILQLDD